MINTKRYLTADGFEFYHLRDAENHAKTLTYRSIKIIDEQTKSVVISNRDLKETTTLIEGTTKLGALTAFESDLRKAVITAVRKQKNKLTNEN